MGFLELRRQCGVSPEARRGSQGASRAAPGKSGLHAVAMGIESWLSSHGRGLGPGDALKKDSRGLSRGAAGNPGFHRLVPVTSGSFSACL